MQNTNLGRRFNDQTDPMLSNGYKRYLTRRIHFAFSEGRFGNRCSGLLASSWHERMHVSLGRFALRLACALPSFLRMLDSMGLFP